MHAARELRMQPLRPTIARPTLARPSTHTHEGECVHTHEGECVQHAHEGERLLLRSRSSEVAHTSTHTRAPDASSAWVGALDSAGSVRYSTVSEALLARVCGSDLDSVTHARICIDTTEAPADVLGRVLPRVTHLDLHGSILASLRDLGTALQCVRVLCVSACALTDLDGISAFPALTELYIDQNPLTDVTPLAMHDSLRLLDASNTQLADDTALAVLGTCSALQTLNIARTPLAARDDLDELLALHLSHMCVLDGRVTPGASTVMPSEGKENVNCAGRVHAGQVCATARTCARKDSLSASTSTLSMNAAGARATSAHSATVSVEASTDTLEDADSRLSSPAHDRGGVAFGVPLVPRPGTAPVARSRDAAMHLLSQGAVRPLSSHLLQDPCDLSFPPKSSDPVDAFTHRANSSSGLTHGDNAVVFAGPAALAMRKRRGSVHGPAAPEGGPGTRYPAQEHWRAMEGVTTSSTPAVSQRAHVTRSGGPSTMEASIVRSTSMRPQTAAVLQRPRGSNALHARLLHGAATASSAVCVSSSGPQLASASRGLLAPRVSDGIATFVIPSIADYSGEEEDDALGSAAFCDASPSLRESASTDLSMDALPPTHADTAHVDLPAGPHAPSTMLDCGASSAGKLSDDALVRWLRHKPKDVRQLHTRESYIAFFSGTTAERMRRLLRAAYSDLPPAEREERTQRRLQLVADVLAE